MPSDPRPYVTVDKQMPLHDKVRDLSHLSFRLLIEAWCYCGRVGNNGKIEAAKWAKMRTPAARRELIEAGLAEVDAVGVVTMHDYLKHQLSRAEEEALSADRSRAAIQGNHQRWHVAKGVVHPECPLCPNLAEPLTPEDEEVASAIASVITDASQTDRNINPSLRRSVETSGGVSSNATPATRPPRQCPKHEGMTDAPACGRCKDARIAHDEWRAPLRAAQRCDEHHQTHYGTCTGCEADKKAKSA